MPDSRGKPKPDPFLAFQKLADEIESLAQRFQVPDFSGIRFRDPGPIRVPDWDAWNRELIARSEELFEELQDDWREPSPSAGSPRSAIALPEPAPTLPPSAESEQGPRQPPEVIIRTNIAARAQEGRGPNMDAAAAWVVAQHPKWSRDQARALYHEITGRGIEDRGHSTRPAQTQKPR